MGINVQRFTYTFGASEDSVAVDISTLPEALSDVASTDHAFARVTNTMHSAPIEAGTTSDLHNDDLGINSVLTDTGTVTLTRQSSGANHDVLVYVEIWEDDSSGGDDGFTVRWHDNFTATSKSDTQAVTFTDQNQCVPIICGVSDEYTSAHWARAGLVAEMYSSGFRIRRNRDSTDTIVSIALVEWGSNFTIQNNISHGFSNHATEETETISSVTWNNAFIFGSFMPRDDQPSNNDIAALAYPGSSTSITFYMADGGNADSSQDEFVAHIVEHADLSVEHEDTISGSGTALSASGTAPVTNDITLGTTLSDLSKAAAIAFSVTLESDNAYPRNHINYRLTSTSNFEFWRARVGGEVIDWAYQVADFSEVGGSSTVSGDAAQDSDPATQTASGELIVSGSSSQDAKESSQSGMGSVVQSGTVSQDGQPGEQSASGSLLYSGSAAQTTEKSSQSASGSQTVSGSGAQDAAAATQSASGTEILSGSSAQEIESATQTASGSALLSGSAAQTGESGSQALSGGLVHSGTVIQEGESSEQSASGGSVFSGTAAQDIQASEQSASGELSGQDGVAIQTIEAAEQSANGSLLHSGTSAQTLTETEQGAAGAVVHSGTSGQDATETEQTASGGVVVSGSTAQTSDSTEQTGGGTLTHSGTATQEAAEAEQSLTGTTPLTGTAEQTGEAATQSASGGLVHSGTVSQEIQPATQTAGVTDVIDDVEPGELFLAVDREYVFRAETRLLTAIAVSRIDFIASDHRDIFEAVERPDFEANL